MDKIEYRELTKSIKNRYLKKDYEGVIDLSDQIELERIRENSTLEIVAKSYEALGRCDLAREALLIAYKRTPSGKRIAYNLAMLCIKLDDLDSAVMFYEDFCKMAPRDNQRLILKYEIGRAGGVPLKDLVRVLEVYNAREMDDKWEYELARLYHEMGDGEKCAATCDQVILWYANGEYEKKALELKNMHKALTPEQQSRYEEIMAGILNDGATIVPIESRETAGTSEELSAPEEEITPEMPDNKAANAEETLAAEENASSEERSEAAAEEPENAVEEHPAEEGGLILDIPSAQNWNKKPEAASVVSSAEPTAVHEIEYDTKHLGSEGEISDDNDNENIAGQMSVLSMLEAYKQKTAEDVDNKVGKDRAAQIMAEVASTHDSSALEEFEADEEEFMQEESVEVIEPEVPLFNREDVIEPEDDGGEDIGERAAEFDFEKKSKETQNAEEEPEVQEPSEYDDYEDSDDEADSDSDEDIEDSGYDEEEEEYLEEETDEEYDDSDDEYDEEYDEEEYEDEEYEDEEENRPIKSKSYRKKEKRRSMADDILDGMVVDGGFTIEEEPEEEYDEPEEDEFEDEYDDSDEEGFEEEYGDSDEEGFEDEYDDTESDDSEDVHEELIEESEAEYDEEESEAADDRAGEELPESEEPADAIDEIEAEAASDAEAEEIAAELDKEDTDETEDAKSEYDKETGHEEAVTEEAEEEYDENEIDESEEECDEAYDDETDDEYEEIDEESDIADQVAAAFEEFEDNKTSKREHKKTKAEKSAAGSCVQEVAVGIGDVFGSLFKKNKKADIVEEVETPEGVFEIEEEPEEIVVPRRGNKGQAKGKYAPERTQPDKEQIKAEKARIKAEKDKAKAEKAREKAEKIRQKAERLLAEKARREELAAEEAEKQEAVKSEVQSAEKKHKKKTASSDQELFQTVEPKDKTAQAEQKDVEIKATSKVQVTEEVKAEPEVQKAEVKAEPEVQEIEVKAAATAKTSSEEFNLEEFINEEIGSEPVQPEETKAAAEPKKKQPAKSEEESELSASIEEIVAKSAESLSREQKRPVKPVSKTMRANAGFSSAVVTPAQGVARNAATVAAAQSIANPAAARLFAENPEPEVPANDITSKLPKLVIPAFIKNRTSQKNSASLDSKSLDEILNSAIKDSDKEEERFTVNVDELLDETIKDENCKKKVAADLDGFNLDDFINPNGTETNKSAAKKQAAFDEIFGKADKDIKSKKEESKPKKTSAAATQPLPKIQIQSPARKFGVGEYKLSREQKKELAEFLLIDGMEEEICSTIAKLVTKKKSGDETGGHLIVTGDAKTGKTFLTVEILKAVNQEVGHGNTRVAKVQAQAINGKNIMDVLSKVTDSDLIIENIGRLEDDTVLELIQAVRVSNAPTMIILEGNELAADTMIQNFPDIGKIFKTRINIGELTLTQWADLAQKYAASQGYSIDGMAQLALHAKIDQINTPDMRLGFKQVRQIIDDAIDKAEKRSSAKLFSAFGKKNDDELIPLMEDNFM